MQIARTLLAISFLSISFLAFSSPADFPKCGASDDPGYNWATQNYDKAVAALIPSYIPQHLLKDEWVLNVRIIPSFFEEFQFTFLKQHNGKIHTMAAAPEDPILNQLSELKKSFPNEEFYSLVKKVRVKRWKMDFSSSKNFENKIHFLQQYKLPPRPKDLFCLDGTGYEISLQTVAKKIDFSFGCDEKPQTELLQFIREFRDQLYGYKQIDYKLLRALEKKDAKKAIQLLHNGANPELRTEEGDQSWLSALSLRNTELINLILQRQPKLIHRDKSVFSAASYGSANIVKFLNEAGADINEDVRGETPLIAAAGFQEEGIHVIDRTANDYEAVVNELIKAGADLNRNGKDGKNALMVAIGARHEAIAGSLIEAGTDLNVTDNCGFTAIMLATESDQQDIVEKLLRAGADPKIVNAQGKTALDYAQEKGFTDLIRLLK
jgi:ankyrin repeat protein